MKLNGGTQHSPCLLLADPRGASMEPMEHSTAPRDCTTHCFCQLPIILSQSALPCTVDDSDDPNFFSHTVGEGPSPRIRFTKWRRALYTKPDLHTGLAQCRHFFTSAASASSLGTHLVRSVQRTFNPEKRKNGNRFWKVPAPFPNSPPQKLSGFTENLS